MDYHDVESASGNRSRYNDPMKTTNRILREIRDALVRIADVCERAEKRDTGR